MTSRPLVTFVGHDASRTGAPIVLLSLLRWLDRNADADVQVVLRRGGPLLDEYSSVVTTTLLDSYAVRLSSGLAQGSHAVGAAGPASLASAVERRLVRRHARAASGAELIVANTLVALGTAATLVRGGSQLVCHVHELDHVADRVLPAERRGLLDRVDRFVATGAAVERMLVDRLSIDPARVSTVDAFIDPPREVDPAAVAEARGRLAGGERPVVLSVGATSRRKGPDRFADLLAMLADHPTRPVGVWLGGDPYDVVGSELRGDLRRAGLTDHSAMLGSLGDASAVLAAASVVVSTAREDPFPLSVLEAAAHGVPVVTFDSGGAGELLRRCGNGPSVVPLGDSFAMRDAVARLLDDPANARAEGDRLSRHVRATHLTEHLAPQWWQAVSELVDGAPGVSPAGGATS